MKNKLKNNQKGFTIIEVLIVLAIAGLIMVIVFLAVPALQRNSRNTQRTNDASKVAAAVAQCMSNRNGVVTQCNTTAQLQAAGGLDLTRLSQLTAVNPGTGAPGNLNNANFGFQARCQAGGNAADTGGTIPARQAAVQYSIEDNAGAPQNRCIDS